MFLKFLKQYQGKFLLLPLLCTGLLVGVYTLHAQESGETSPIEISSETEGEDPENPSPPPIEEPPIEENTESEPEEDGGLLGDFIDFVEENVFEGEQLEQPEDLIIEEVEEELVPEILESVPAPMTTNSDVILFRNNVPTKKSDIDYTNGSYACEALPFSLNVSNGSPEGLIKIKNINQVGTGQRNIIVGELPVGYKIVFSNSSYVKNITDNQTEFPISVIKDETAQKGSFTIPIIYSVGDIKVMCQMNIVN